MECECECECVSGDVDVRVNVSVNVHVSVSVRQTCTRGSAARALLSASPNALSVAASDLTAPECEYECEA